MSLDCITHLHGVGEPKAVVIWLHGLGASGEDFLPTLPLLNLPSHLPVLFYFPHAPFRSVTLNNGHMMRAWYDILGIGEGVPEDQAGINTMMVTIHHLLDKCITLVEKSTQVFLVGFSQGGAMALHAGLRYPHVLGGIAGLSTYLPVTSTVTHLANKNTPIFLAHGTSDPIVAYQFGKNAYDILKAQNYPIQWHSYPIPHSICKEEFKELGNWLIRNLSTD